MPVHRNFVKVKTYCGSRIHNDFDKNSTYILEVILKILESIILQINFINIRTLISLKFIFYQTLAV